MCSFSVRRLLCLNSAQACFFFPSEPIETQTTLRGSAGAAPWPREEQELDKLAATEVLPLAPKKGKTCFLVTPGRNFAINMMKIDVFTMAEHYALVMTMNNNLREMA